MSIPPPTPVSWKPSRKMTVAGLAGLVAIAGGLVTLYGVRLPPWVLVVAGPSLTWAAGYLKSE